MIRPYFIACDIHLGAVPHAAERGFLAFLDHVGANASTLLIAGDLFDFWFEYGPVVPGKHFRVLAALAALVEAGIPVLLIVGNHDAWGGRFLREEVGITHYREAFRTGVMGRTALVAHGDGVGPGDLGYKVMKAVIRSRLATAGFRALHPELGLRLARAASSTEERAGYDPTLSGRARHIEDWAVGELRRDPGLSYVVCGHAHVPALREVEPGRFYLNAGDWVRNTSYITVDGEGIPTLHRWEP